MLSKLKIIFFALLTIFTLYSIYLSAFFVLRGEVHLTNDIGRDFLLLQELDQKKIVFIGARANVPNVFHGVFWTYLNYPAYLIGHGNPVVVAWFWVLLGVVFLATTFLIIRKLFNTLAALLGVALLSIILATHTNDIFGQEATFYFMPFFLFTIYMYIQSKKVFYLVLHFIMVGIFVQLNIGVGGLFAMLSVILSLGIIIKNRLWKHLATFLFIPLMLLNYIVFDAHHGFHILKALLGVGKSSKFIIPINSWIQNRIDNLISMQIFTGDGKILRWILFLLMSVFGIVEIKNKSKQKNFFLLLGFYYFGYMLLSYLNKGIMLVDYIYLLTPISVIWLAAFIKGRYKMIFIPVIIFIIYLNFNFANSYLLLSQKIFIGKSQDSWVSLNTVAQSIIKSQKGQEFGYYVYSPDSFAYQQRYAMIYAFSNAHAKAFEYVKKETTYVIVSSRPADNPYMGQDWWIKNEARITNYPIEKKTFPSGYMTEKFNLTPDEQKIPHDPNIELGLHFR